MMAPPAIFLTHTADDLRLIFDQQAVDELRTFGRVILNPRNHHLSSQELLQDARGCEIIISEWGTGADREFFAKANDLVAFIRAGVEIRNVDVDGASAND